MSKKNTDNLDNFSIKEALNPLWLSISESAKIGGVTNKTIRRAIQDKKLAYKIINERYYVKLSSLIDYLYSNKKLRNKLIFYGLGQYIDKWKK